MREKIQINHLEKINDRIYALRTPYKDIFTTVYVIKTDCGALLFDAASYDCDVEDAIIPALHQLGIGEEDLKYVLISHYHADHAGGLKRLLAAYPSTRVITRNDDLKERLSSYTVLSPNEGELLLNDLGIVWIPGHTKDSLALLDHKTKTLISGDGLQLYGIFGSGNWGANISFPSEYMEKIQALREMDIDAILTAHDYHPLGQTYFGKAEIAAALDACLAPFARIQQLIDEAPDADDETVCERYNAQGALPTLGVHVVKQYRKAFPNPLNTK